MKNDKQRRVSRGRRGSNEAKLVLVGVASGKSGNLRSPSIPHAEAGSFASWTLLEPYAIRGRHVEGGERGGVKGVDQALPLRGAYGVKERDPSGGPPGTQNLGGKLSMC